MKNVLLLVHDDAGQEARLQAALDLTRALDGHLNCIDVTIVPALMIDDYDGSGGALLFDEERRREADNKAALTARLAQEDVAWDWTDRTACLADGVTDAAMLADIIVLSGGVDAYPSTRDVVSQIVMRARQPVLAIPETLERLSLSRALIAWDGEQSCAATMRACVPLLALADEIEIFMVRDGADRVPAEDAADYLSRHGIHATVHAVSHGAQAADVHIEAECARWQPDYLLMGAYGHGRLVETFGGVTKRMLGHAKLPILLGH